MPDVSVGLMKYRIDDSNHTVLARPLGSTIVKYGLSIVDGQAPCWWLSIRISRSMQSTLQRVTHIVQNGVDGAKARVESGLVGTGVFDWDTWMFVLGASN